MPTAARQLLDVRRIYVEPAAAALPRGRAVLDRFPAAERIEVDSRWRIPTRHRAESSVDRWVRVKVESLVLGVKKSLSAGRTGGRPTSSRRPPRTAAPVRVLSRAGKGRRPT
ncbi:MAG TPA: hypothetical protein VE547_05100 [Mycobacteriales bacterium]|nr:hypothetical protein [Mycobacteriales bacterium]